MRGFDDRAQAGRLLVRELSREVAGEDVVVLGLARGGVPVAFEIASALGAPLDVLVVRKIGVPGQRELAMGAVASGGIVVRNDEVVRAAGIDESVFRRGVEAAKLELAERERLLRGEGEPVPVAGRTAVVVDDGIATGSTMEAAVASLRSRGPARVVIAVPVAPPEVIDRMSPIADAVVCLVTPRYFGAVGAWYRTFTQTGDAEVRKLLEASTW